MTGLRAGVATVDFTPEPGLPLMGNFRDDYAARGVHDRLRAKAMVFEDVSGNRAAVLALDVCMLDRHNVALVRRVIGSQCDVPPQSVLVHATHTHSAPAPCDRYLFGADFEPHRPAVDAMLTRAAGAVARAEADLAEATLAIGYAEEDRVSFNRRLRRRDGSTQMNWEALAPGFDPDQIEAAWGPIDPQVACLVVERDDTPVAAVVNFGLHPAILAGDNWLYSADYPGCLAEALGQTMGGCGEKGTGSEQQPFHVKPPHRGEVPVPFSSQPRGGDFTCLFLNGCSGNVNHVDYRDPLQGRGYKMLQRVGYMLGAAAHRAIAARTPVAADRIAAASRRVSLARIQIAEEEQARCRRVLQEARSRPPQGQVDGLPEAFFAELRLEMAALQEEPDEVEVMALRLGDVALAGLPGENFCESGLAIKRRSPAPHALVAGLCNDAIGYLPTRESFDQGGYETTIGSTMYEPGAAERLVDAAAEQLARLFEE